MNSVKNIKNKIQATGRVNNLSFNQLPKIKNVAFIKDEIDFVLDDGRVVYIPVNWSKKLLKATPKQRQNFKNNGIHVF
ncbi:MAG TPA: DUF2442 domain-containing protein [Hanamia sp.]|nr:DUF2442 domain-containing protein [Hanamia sp.]